jgi:hypothetical protein
VWCFGIDKNTHGQHQGFGIWGTIEKDENADKE